MNIYTPGIGIGQGLAQVFDTRDYANQVIRLRMMREEKERRDSFELGKHLTTLNPEEIRTQDMPQAKQLLGKIQQVYAENKGLYTNPSVNAKKYQEVKGYEAELKNLIASSRQQEKNFLEIGKMRLSNNSNVSDDAYDRIKELQNMPTSEIMKATGGRLWGFEDVETRLKPIDWNPLNEEFKKYSGDRLKRSLISEKPDGKNGLLDFQVKQTEVIELDPKAIGMVTEGRFATDENFRKTFQKEFESTSPEAIKQLQDQVDVLVAPEDRFNITNPEGYAKAVGVMKYIRQTGQPKVMENPEYDKNWQMKLQDDRQKQQWDMLKYTQDRQDARQNRAIANQNNKQTDDNMLMEDAGNIINALSSGDLSKAQEQSMIIYNSSLMFGGKPSIVSKTANVGGKVKTVNEQQFVKMALQQAGKDAVVSNMMAVTEKDARELYRQGKQLLVIPVNVDGDDGKPTTKNVVINPLNKSAQRQAYAFLKQAKVGTRKYGSE